MFFFVLMLCLQSQNNECVVLKDTPTVYYVTAEQCKTELQSRANVILKILEKDKETGTMEGRCMKDESIRPA